MPNSINCKLNTRTYTALHPPFCGLLVDIEEREIESLFVLGCISRNFSFFAFVANVGSAGCICSILLLKWLAAQGRIDRLAEMAAAAIQLLKSRLPFWYLRHVKRL
jgi:hypothetical protein